MSVQTSYSTTHNEAYAGMVADQQLLNTVSKVNTDTVNIPYGKAVVRDGEAGGKLPTSGSVAADFVGVAMYELNRAYADGDTFGAVTDNDMTVVTSGVVWVKSASDNVTVGQAAFYRVGATNTGDFANAAGSAGTASVAVSGKFLTAGDTGDLVKLSLVVGG